ncbi:hypothetical protein [Nesterenkonia muleiensis]|uniref:hypothetical protein n=1 Tax=Nesterenkonia muleiensis TaxID=2282648 RepID=UPI000E73167F|nr:hypothetical protein [Nesterenkonia muleiensis]
MSAETTEQYTANGDELRARYLPVSRKELRRRREEAERTSQEETGSDAESADEAPVEPDHGDELARLVEDTSASEGNDLPEEPAAEAEQDQDPEPFDAADAAASDVAEETSGEEPAVVLPAPPEPAEEPVRPEEEIADAEAEEDPESDSEVEPDQAAEPEDTGRLSSRRARRLLRDTQSIPRLSPELMAELDATNAEIAVIEDPNRVDPELLKKQQALAAKAMQANQERMRKEQAAAEKERRRRSRERPESQVLTDKMLRDSLGQDPEEMQYFTGQIEPVHAQGAHGLDLNKMVDATSRQANRQNALMWVTIVLGVLLLAAIAAGIYFFVL